MKEILVQGLHTQIDGVSVESRRVSKRTLNQNVSIDISETVDTADQIVYLNVSQCFFSIVRPPLFRCCGSVHSCFNAHNS